MGIRGLGKIISLYSKNSISEINIEELKGKKIAIDSEILLYRYKSKENIDFIGINNSHIYGFINNILWYLKNGITPIYIFDGAPISAKRDNVLVKRYIHKEKLYQRFEELENKFYKELEEYKDPKISINKLTPEQNETFDQIQKLRKRLGSLNVTKKYKDECRYLLKLLGIPFINATEDAEALCITLQAQGKVDYVYTEDTDVMTYASGIIERDENFRPLIIKKSSLSGYVNIIDVKKLLNELELTSKSFIDMCILSGCDFCPNISKIGPIKSFYYIKKYDNIENFIKNTGVAVPEDFNYQHARDIFSKDYSQNINKSLTLGNIDINGLKYYLINERSIDPNSIIYKYKKHLDIFNTLQ